MYTHHNGIVYCADWNVIDPLFKPARPLRVLIVTSVRDTGTCDRNGDDVETPEGSCYMKGMIESAASESRPDGQLAGLIELVGVITDDIEGETGDYPVLPTPGQPWLHDLQQTNGNGRPIRDLTVNIPSYFRKLPWANMDGRRAGKEQFERQVFAHMQAIKADVIVSDHLMLRVEHLVNGFGLFGRVLNIHPAITVLGHPFAFPGKTPTADAIARAQRWQNDNDYEFVVGLERGEVRTGATLHFMDTIIDHGPAIAYMCTTPVYAHDEPHHLRARNYPTKECVFLYGMEHYARHLYPYLDRVNFQNFANRYWLGRK